jgi:hypothetical protein
VPCAPCTLRSSPGARLFAAASGRPSTPTLAPPVPRRPHGNRHHAHRVKHRRHLVVRLAPCHQRGDQRRPARQFVLYAMFASGARRAVGGGARSLKRPARRSGT